MAERFKKIIKEFEGYSPIVYQDEKGRPTVGVGSSLTSPEAVRTLSSQGYDVEKVKAGEEQITPEDLDMLHKSQVEEKRQLFNKIKQKDFPSANLDPDKEAALLSMMYNNPRLIGPNLRSLLSQNRDIDVAKEILLRSNKAKSPGIQKRRIKEAKIYSGKKWPEVVSSLSENEAAQIQDLIGKIENEHERARVKEEFPLILAPRYNRLFNK